MSNIFVVSQDLRILHMLKGSEMISEDLITKTIEQNFRIRKQEDLSHHQFYQKFHQDLENGVYTAYLLGRDERRKFYLSNEWLALKKKAMSEHKQECVMCGVTRDLQADHIKPRWKYPELELDPENIQILCRTCNNKKSGN